jgi:hypothetical protein
MSSRRTKRKLNNYNESHNREKYSKKQNNNNFQNKGIANVLSHFYTIILDKKDELQLNNIDNLKHFIKELYEMNTKLIVDEIITKYGFPIDKVHLLMQELFKLAKETIFNERNDVSFEEFVEVIWNIKQKILSSVGFDKEILIKEGNTTHKYLISFGNWNSIDMEKRNQILTGYDLNIKKKKFPIIGILFLCDELGTPSELAGYITGSYVFKNNKFNYYVSIDMVFIIEKFTGKGLCKYLLSKFIEYTDLLSPLLGNAPLNFKLYNAGGFISCRCYINTFANKGYKGVYKKSYNKTNYDLNIKLCNNNKTSRDKIVSASKSQKTPTKITNNNFIEHGLPIQGISGVDMIFTKI